MTDATEVVGGSDDSPIYTHPTIRTSTHEELLVRLQQVRDRRLVAALQYHSTLAEKNKKIANKLQAQWDKNKDAAYLKLSKVDEAIDQLDRMVSKMIEISHQIAIAEADE